MKIKICAENAEKINKILADVNGKATEHTYTSWIELEMLSMAAEKAALKLLSKKEAIGAEYVSTSGAKLPNSYNHPRKVTNIKIVRGSSAWFLVAVSSSQAWNAEGHKRLILTAEQDRLAVERFRNQYATI